MDKKWFENELRNILEYWKNVAFDKKNNTFYTHIGPDNVPTYKEFCNITLISRGIWAFSSGYEYFKDESYLEIAKKLFDFLDAFKNDKFYWWAIDENGKCTIPIYRTYEFNFCVYGCAKLYRVTKEKKHLDKAMEFFKFIEAYSRDKDKGYFSTMDESLVPIERRFGTFGGYGFKDMNNSIHIMEAYAMLYSVNKDEKVKEAFLNSVNLVINNVYNEKKHHLDLIFDKNLKTTVNNFSYGHDIETSWLLTRCTALIDDRDLIEKINKISVDLAYSGVNDGYDKNFGGLLETKEDDKKLWWDQAEAVVGSYNAYLLTKDEFFREKSKEFLEYIKEHFIAPDGEWYETISRDGTKILSGSKVGPWKCPYHNSRMCLEMIKMGI